MAAEPVVIVGCGGIFPGGPDVESFWRHVAAGKDAGRPVPAGRWSWSPEQACRPGEFIPDTTYSTWGCYLDDIPLSAELRQRDPDLIASLDPVCHLALEAARRALLSAKLPSNPHPTTPTPPPSRIGVILGHIVLPTEATSAIARNVLLRTFEERLFDEFAQSPPSATAGLWSPRNRRIAALPAELIAEWFGFGGPAFTLDAACASSLYALKLAVEELQAGRVDAMLAGGLSRPDCQYTQIGFAQLQALSRRGCCAPLSTAADGLVVGEGAGLFVLKRLSDALAAGDRIEAVIAGIGLSNDRGANLLAPHSEGQLRAMRAAYEQAGWSPDDVDYIECHATGTPTGDAVELDSLHRLWANRSSRPGQCVLGAVKSNVGHLLTGAGGAGLMKILGMLRHQELWPIANYSAPAAALQNPHSPFRVAPRAESWPEHPDRPRRAAINAFGFGGINAHVLIEEYRPAGRFADQRHPPNDTRSNDIVLVGVEATVGPWNDLAAVRERLFGDDDQSPEPPANWGVEWSQWFPAEHPQRDLAAYRIEQIEIPVGEFRIPPLELPDMLPQQQLMLQVTAKALDQSGVGRSLGDRAGVFLGVSLDPNTTNFHCRWMIAERAPQWAHLLRLPLRGSQLDAWIAELQTAFGPPLTPNRVMGNLAAITASRIAREFDVGGPSFTISADEDSRLHALRTAAEALHRGELDVAVVGAVEFGGDARAQFADLPMDSPLRANDAAVAFVLKRRADAERDGNPILAKIGFTETVRVAGAGAALGEAPEFSGKPGLPSRWSVQPRPPVDASHRLGFSLATAQLMNVLRGVIALADGLDETSGHPALRNRRDGLRRIDIAGVRSAAAVTLEEVTSAARPIRALGLSQRNRSPGIAIPGLPRGKLAFVFPGSGNAFVGMGRELLSAFPGVLRRQHAENDTLCDQLRPDLIWDGTPEALARDHKAMIFGQVSLGTALCDLLAACGVRPAASIGYSLGESAALFGLRAWQDRDEMLARMRRSDLFGSDLVSPFNAARTAWNTPADRPVPWLSGVINAPVEQVREAVSRKSRAYLLIINTPGQCVIGGENVQIDEIVRALNATFVPLPSPSTVHCEILNEVRRDYFELHRMRTTPPDGVAFYSAASGQHYDLNEESAANAILAQATTAVDFPQVIQNAYRDGVRLFLEIGPGHSCTKMIDEILADQPYWAAALCPATSDPVGRFLHILSELESHGVPVDWSPVFGEPRETDHRRKIVTPVGRAAFEALPRREAREAVRESVHEDITAFADDDTQNVMPLIERPKPNAERRFFDTSNDIVTAFGSMLTERAEAHAAFLRFAQRSQELAATLADASRSIDVTEPFTPPSASERFHTSTEPPRALDYDQCLAYAIGNIGDVLGPMFAEIDQFPTRVRLPDEPLMLCHRIVAIDGEPLSMTHGQLITEHDIVENAWYLDCGRIPTCIAVEAGQADLFLSGWLGIDFETRGEAVYRLLDAVVTFHDALPGPGKTIRYDIRINQFFRQGETWLFRFEFDATVDGRPLLTMREGCAGFFTDEALASGKGIVHTALDRQPRPGKRPDDWTDPVPMTVEHYSDEQVTALRRGDLAGCFGPVFRGLPIHNPVTLPGDEEACLSPLSPGGRGAGGEGDVTDSITASRNATSVTSPSSGLRPPSPSRGEGDDHRGRMRLVDRVLKLDPAGGKYGLGLIRAEADIHPNDWFLTCHFCDDQVMPGTLMYECCLHTLRIYLLRMGWIGEEGDVVYEPIPEVRSRLKCRGQVLASTKRVWYEVTLKEIGYGSPGIAIPGLRGDDFAYCLADALMYADGKAIVEITDMSVRLTGLTREKVERLWSLTSPSGGRQPCESGVRHSGEHNQGAHAPRSGKPLFDTDRITEFAIGKPSLAFGDRYRVFDDERKIARLPGPPFQFLDRIVSIENCEPWKLVAGGVIVAEYDVPPDAWYFAANRQSTMPFAVLLETALQPCGWLAAYLGSALTSDTDLSFRNLGGKATQFRAVTPDSGTLATTVKMTAVSQSGGMIIQHYEFDLKCRGESVYRGTTYFGFFSKASLANQIGIRDAGIYQPAAEELARAESFEVPHDAPFPSDRFRMVDQVAAYILDGGPHKLGFLRGTIDVDPSFWFFKAHFYQDPVWPGSLGLESFLQLLKVYAVKRWGAGVERSLLPRGGGEGTEPKTVDQFQTVALNAPHEWVYRGQVIPADKTVTVDVVITAVDDANRRATASGFLTVDGRVIYQMIDFTVQLA